MKKDLIFAPILLVVGILLFLLRMTGMTAHIAISIVGVVALVVYAIVAKKTWKLPALEIIMRVCYGLALISGIVLKAGVRVAALPIVHKASAVLFVVLLIVLLTHKVATNKKA